MLVLPVSRSGPSTYTALGANPPGLSRFAGPAGPPSARNPPQAPQRPMIVCRKGRSSAPFYTRSRPIIGRRGTGERGDPSSERIPSSHAILSDALLLEGRSQLGVRLVERLRGRVKVLAHPVQALDHLRRAGVELRVRRLELLARGVSYVTAGNQVVDQLLQLAEVPLDRRLARLELLGGRLHVRVG